MRKGVNHRLTHQVVSDVYYLGIVIFLKQEPQSDSYLHRTVGTYKSLEPVTQACILSLRDRDEPPRSNKPHEGRGDFYFLSNATAI